MVLFAAKEQVLLYKVSSNSSFSQKFSYQLNTDYKLFDYFISPIND